MLLSTLVGVVLPDEEDQQALVEDQSWRIVFGLQPLMFLIVLVLFLCLVRSDPAKFYVLTGKDEKANNTIDQVYHTNGDSRKIDAVKDFLLAASGEVRVEVSCVEALVSDEQYVRASWVAIFIMMA